MASRVVAKIKPKRGVAHLLHLFLVALLPILVFVMVRINFPQLALVFILLSKWRIFAVKPRHWPANLRANAIDLIVGVSVLIFMMHSGTQMLQLVWAVAYAIWLLFIKPSSHALVVGMQALIGQIAGMTALFIHFGDVHSALLVAGTWAICYFSARHFLTSYDEPLTRMIAYLWGYFGAAVVWVLSHWLLFYGPIAQPTLLLGVMAFALGGMYYLDETDRLSVFYRRQIMFIMLAIIVIIIVFSDWGDKTI